MYVVAVIDIGTEYMHVLLELGSVLYPRSGLDPSVALVAINRESIRSRLYVA